jgi:hypothetical protein
MEKRHRKEAEQIKAFISDGNIGSTQGLTEAILLMALRANVRLSPEVAASLYLAACKEVEGYHKKDTDRTPSNFEVDCVLSICRMRIPVLEELERFKRIKVGRQKRGGAQ